MGHLDGAGGQIRIHRFLWVAGALAIAAVLALGSAPASALDRQKGDYWTYSMMMNLYGIDVVGTFTQEFVGEDTVTVGDKSYDVNLMKLSGSLTGEIDFLSTSANASLGGFVYEAKSGIAIVKNDLFIWLNTTFGTGDFSMVNRTQLRITTTFSPPYLSEFDPATAAEGDTWYETLGETVTTTEWWNGVVEEGPDTYVDTVTYGFSISSSVETVVTEAGTFETLKITSTDDYGNSTVSWWSAEVGNVVKESEYEPGSSQPMNTIMLTNYGEGGGLSTILIIGLGVGVLVAAVIVLIAVLAMRRRPGQPVPYQPVFPQPMVPAPPPAPPAR